MIDLNEEQEQKEQVFGPVPGGSKVLVRLDLQTPKFPDHENPLIAQAKSGLLQLNCKVSVVAGAYEGVSWYENITLPASAQRCQLRPEQQTACRIGGALLRAIVESARRIDPKATDAKSCRGRQISGPSDIDGVEIPCKLGIDKQPFTAQNGNTYWRNRISSVIPCTDENHRKFYDSFEIITDGPVTGEGGGRGKRQSGNNADFPLGDNPAWAEQANDNDLPF